MGHSTHKWDREIIHTHTHTHNYNSFLTLSALTHRGSAEENVEVLPADGASGSDEEGDGKIRLPPRSLTFPEKEEEKEEKASAPRWVGGKHFWRTVLYAT